jgi:hypothetical protein
MGAATVSAMKMTQKCRRATGVFVTTKVLRSELNIGLTRERALLGWQFTIDYQWLATSSMSSREAQARVIAWAKKEYPQLRVTGGTSKLVIYMRRNIS